MVGTEEDRALAVPLSAIERLLQSPLQRSKGDSILQTSEEVFTNLSTPDLASVGSAGN
jgi:hypothetical protein